MDYLANWNKLLPEERVLALNICERTKPVGAAVAQRILKASGFDRSQASATRYLQALDRASFTYAKGRAGRLVADGARLFVKSQVWLQARDNAVSQLFEDTSMSDLVDLLILRKGIEAAAIPLAVERAEDEDITRIEETIRAYDEHAEEGSDFSSDAINFHLYLCEATHSPTFRLVAQTLIPEMGRLEPMLVASARMSGKRTASQDSHRRIWEALQARDANLAKKLMADHFDEMISLLSA
ncbi:MAG: FadR/GntR family transcriptional regulator [Canibacter sp.]